MKDFVVCFFFIKEEQSDLALVNDEQAVVGQKFLSPDIEVSVSKRTDINDVCLTDFRKKIADDFVKTIMADFNAVGVANSLGPDSFIAVFGDFKWRQGFFDQAGGRSFVDRHA